MRFLLIAAALAAMSSASYAQVHVDGYTRSNGTYVEPYYRSTPNSTPSDNYSTKGNSNPYTGQAGTHDPYGSSGSGLYGGGSHSRCSGLC